MAQMGQRLQSIAVIYDAMPGYAFSATQANILASKMA
jgi:hypothetical protein